MPGTGAWFLGATIIFISFVPLTINLAYPWLPLISLHNAIVAIGQAITVAGVYQFFGKRPVWRLMTAIVVGFLLLHTWYLYVDYNVVARTVIASAALAALNVLGVWRLIAEPWTEGRVARLFAVVGSCSLVTTFALRALLSGFHVGEASMGASSFENNITYLLAFIIVPTTATATMLGLIMMTVRRLAGEREQALGEARKAAEHFQELASYDSLTQAYNRRLFMLRANEELSKCERNGQPCSVLLIDLDHFKQINDAYGHASGDEALCYFAGCVRASLRDFDVFGRIGGEEFAIVLSGVGQEQAGIVCNRLRETVASGTIKHDGKSFTITMSGGVVTAKDSDDVQSLLEAADAALYQAKHLGRNRIDVAKHNPSRPDRGDSLFPRRPSSSSPLI
jgi:diguanylate cyclase (GGDEF)-like protein